MHDSTTLKVFKTGTRFLEPAVYEQITTLPNTTTPTHVVVKDYSRYANTPWAFVARFLVNHENVMLNHLDGIAPTAWSNGPYRLVMPFVHGRSLRSDEDPQVLTHLETLVHAMHNKNVVHNDLHSSNILVQENNIPVILDVASAMYFPVRWPLAVLRNRDLANLSKIKRQKCPQLLTDTDRRRLKKPLWVRSLQKLWYQLYRRARLRALRGTKTPGGNP